MPKLLRLIKLKDVISKCEHSSSSEESDDCSEENSLGNFINDDVEESPVHKKRRRVFASSDDESSSDDFSVQHSSSRRLKQIIKSVEEREQTKKSREDFDYGPPFQIHPSQSFPSQEKWFGKSKNHCFRCKSVQAKQYHLTLLDKHCNIALREICDKCGCNRSL